MRYTNPHFSCLLTHIAYYHPN